jgi:hypothetical protein
MALDGSRIFSRVESKLVERITPFRAKPTLVIADGDAPIAS